MALRHLGEPKCGKARADKFTQEQREEIAHKAAQKQWQTGGLTSL
jgi:hypothetical protein